jgi:hypothetical protein
LRSPGSIGDTANENTPSPVSSSNPGSRRRRVTFWYTCRATPRSNTSPTIFCSPFQYAKPSAFVPEPACNV